jgi:hypothetical protein
MYRNKDSTSIPFFERLVYLEIIFMKDIGKIKHMVEQPAFNQKLSVPVKYAILECQRYLVCSIFYPATQSCRQVFLRSSQIKVKSCQWIFLEILFVLMYFKSEAENFPCSVKLVCFRLSKKPYHFCFPQL